ncbi:MAG: FtsK/SpoIIIE domain-containing protein [Anaerolineae bacterium]
MEPMQTEVLAYWQHIIATLRQRGLLQHGLPEADAILLPDRCIFILDMQRLAGIPRETWLDKNLWRQWRAALQGRRVLVSDSVGLAIQVAREPGPRQRLPAVIPLTPDLIPHRPYHVCLGYSRRGETVHLDIAGDHRAILVGGTSGSGKTNLMQSVILQLATRHSPDQVRFAIVDTKMVDFGPEFDRLPHLFAPIASDQEEAHRLVEAVEEERLRRQALMAQAGVADWRDLPAGMPLLLLVIDEAADFARTPTMETLVNIARKGRAFGISILLGTQSPSAQVIDPQVRANLPTAIAFRTRTDIESRIILGRKGAEQLDRPGLALTFLGGRWETVQTLRVTPEVVRQVVGSEAPPAPALSEDEAALVLHALEHLGGAFIINRLAEAFAGRISRRRIVNLAQRWERRR